MDLTVEDIEDMQLDSQGEVQADRSKLIGSHDKGMSMIVLTLNGVEVEPITPAAPGEHPLNRGTDQIMEVICGFLGAAPGHTAQMSEGLIQVMNEDSCWGSEGTGHEPKARGPESSFVTTPNKSLLCMKEELLASLEEPRELGKQRGYKNIKSTMGEKTHSRVGDDTEGSCEGDQQEVTEQQGRGLSPGTDTLLEHQDRNLPSELREEDSFLLQDGKKEQESLEVSLEELLVPILRKSDLCQGAESQHCLPGVVTITCLAESPSLDASDRLECQLPPSSVFKAWAKLGPGSWLGPPLVFPHRKDGRIHCIRLFPKGFGPELEEGIRQCCTGWVASAGTLLCKAKKLFSSYQLHSTEGAQVSGAQEAALIAALQKTTLPGTKPSRHLECPPATHAMPAQPKPGDLSPFCLQRVIQRLKLLMLVKKKPSSS
ncbi:uncharacterized protein LOC102571286 [Alligator mississippiensis]|uniref:Uncharacterized protein n=1 Tax=Alligator mississippiensis TaxID=8496 RepID=A0A151P5J0_ALLMI|nr:uncharacterized protein LOC102571286 [Alligator mississippiensis]XP_019338049.1 uncharacterized protein LOC102571286 [Alligator mississippiensis]KYO44273.1 hypothetical protein Y1Q_0012055 [Alligator mississippiensis]